MSSKLFTILMGQERIEVVSVWFLKKNTVKEMESYVSRVAEVTNSCKA